MGDTNYISCVVKILEVPFQTIRNNNVPITKFRSQLSQVRNNNIVNLIFWGKLSQDIVTYYNVNDYIIVEGYVSIQGKNKSVGLKEIEITVLKVYPFLLS